MKDIDDQDQIFIHLTKAQYSMLLVSFYPLQRSNEFTASIIFLYFYELTDPYSIQIALEIATTTTFILALIYAEKCLTVPFTNFNTYSFAYISALNLFQASSLQIFQMASTFCLVFPSRIILLNFLLRTLYILRIVYSMMESCSIYELLWLSFFSLGRPLGSFYLSGLPISSKNAFYKLCLFFTCVQAAAQDRQLFPHLQVKSRLSWSFLFLRVFF